jgi:hypothetical protein
VRCRLFLQTVTRTPEGGGSRGAATRRSAGEDPGDDDDADDQGESRDHRQTGGATIHQPLAMMPTMPLTRRKTPMPATAIHTVMRAGEICGFSPGVRGVLSLTFEP